ncbi:MAG: hypothetical protein OQJ87_04790 [Rhodospirillales bacterium]|nr:hypothetical protein [Rhodospirillales bacterium]MCW9002016.1 hypothetical protein [Rhodospirillales bacterium]MCW9040897.1 hypothetical protein [Rhodospirillales bacterium]
MATAEAQKKWRRKKRPVKRQLNVVARALIHDYLDEITESYALKGKGEAVTFSCFIVKSLMQQSEFNQEAARLLSVFSENFQRDRELYTSSRCPK